MNDRLRLGCVLLTWEGARPEDLGRAIEKVFAQAGDPIEVVVVCNGIPAPADLPDNVIVEELSENVGITGGRNAGFRRLQELGGIDVVMFLDDDGWLASTTVGEILRSRFEEDPELGIVSFRIKDPDTGITQRRHVPRLRVGDPGQSSDVTTFLGGGSAIRTAVIDQVGPFPEEFFYAHEETDLAWRALDAGWRIRYDTDCVLYHPLTLPTKHPTYFRMNARNRVWLAKRNLPWPVAVGYLGTWVALTLVRTRTLTGLRAWWSGFFEGLRTPAGPRRPIRWRTVWKLTRLGRPPLV
ncbi:MAG TPA: glycosyltransferase family 2 protein [Actinopolymorphaceae bacterium]